MEVRRLVSKFATCKIGVLTLAFTFATTACDQKPPQRPAEIEPAAISPATPAVTTTIAPVDSRSATNPALNRLEARAEVRNLMREVGQDVRSDQKEVACALDALVDVMFQETQTKTKTEVYIGVKAMVDQPERYRSVVHYQCGPGKIVQLADLRSDFDTHVGAGELKVQGSGTYVMETLLLRESSTDLNPIRIDIARIPSANRSEVVRSCGDSTQKCHIVVSGFATREHGRQVITAAELSVDGR